MSITGIPLIVVAVLATLLAAAGTVVTWRRGGRLRVLSRTGAVLLTETLLLLTVGVVVNRSEGFYPTWAALSQSARTSGTTFAVTPGVLDGWLRVNGPAFNWEPAGWTGWRLAGAPVVVVPAGYLENPKWRYSVVLVVDDGSSGFSAAEETAAAKDSAVFGGAVVVFLRTTASTGVDVLARAAPAALAHDLRVTGRRWALVSGASDGGLARRAVIAAPGRYPAIAILPVAGRRNPPPVAGGNHSAAGRHNSTVGGKNLQTQSGKKPAPRGGGRFPAKSGGDVTSKGRRNPSPRGEAPLPVGITVATPADLLTSVAGVTTDPAAGGAGLSAAMRAQAARVQWLRAAIVWACEQTPPPLAASAPQVASLPVQRPKHHHRPTPSSSARTQIRTGGNDVLGQHGN